MVFPVLGPRVPLFVIFKRFVRVYLNITVLFALLRKRYLDFLQPTVRTADRVGLYGVSDVLMDASISPKQAVGVGIFRLEGNDAFDGSHSPLSFTAVFDRDGVRHHPVACILLATPSPNVMRTTDDARFDGLGHPYL